MTHNLSGVPTTLRPQKSLFPKATRACSGCQGCQQLELFVVVLASGQQGTPHPVACLKRTNSGPSHEPEIVANHNLAAMNAAPMQPTSIHCKMY
ncbi:TPA: hypothetical protein ACH3X1_007077 [Trebouxia sp. C0004]